jgi:hypothetical protein
LRGTDSFVRVLSRALTKVGEDVYKLVKKCREVLPPEVIDLLERPDVVELVRYFNGTLISYKVRDEQGRIEDQSESEG